MGGSRKERRGPRTFSEHKEAPGSFYNEGSCPNARGSILESYDNSYFSSGHKTHNDTICGVSGNEEVLYPESWIYWTDTSAACVWVWRPPFASVLEAC